MKRITALLAVLILAAGLVLPAGAAASQPAISMVTITNCDTGRAIVEDELAQFIYHEISENQFSLTSVKGGYYVDFTGGTISESWSEVVYTRIEKEHGRCQIAMPNGLLLADNDSMDTSLESLELYSSDSEALETAWYITDQNKNMLHIMTVGDSLTYGVNPDSDGLNTSYRSALSSYLLDYFGAVSFTGNIKTETAISDKHLLRHSGYSGYVIEDVYNISDHPGYLPLLEPMLNKYTPNVVIMMLGTNDCGLLGGGTDAEGDIEKLMERWEKFVITIVEKLPEDGLLICCSIPPMVGTRDELYNEKIKDKVEELAEAEVSIAFADVASVFEGNGQYFSSDGVHLSDDGNLAVAEVICEVVAANFSRDGFLGQGEDISFTEQSEAQESISAPVTEPSENQNEAQGDDLTVIIILSGVVVLMLAAIVLLLVFRKKMKTE